MVAVALAVLSVGPFALAAVKINFFDDTGTLCSTVGSCTCPNSGTNGAFGAYKSGEVADFGIRGGASTSHWFDYYTPAFASVATNGPFITGSACDSTGYLLPGTASGTYTVLDCTSATSANCTVAPSTVGTCPADPNCEAASQFTVTHIPEFSYGLLPLVGVLLALYFAFLRLGGSRGRKSGGKKPIGEDASIARV